MTIRTGMEMLDSCVYSDGICRGGGIRDPLVRPSKSVRGSGFRRPPGPMFSGSPIRPNGHRPSVVNLGFCGPLGQNSRKPREIRGSLVRPQGENARIGVPPSAMKKIGVPSSKCGKLEFLGLSRHIWCKCGIFAPRPLRPGGLRASAANSVLEVRHNGMHLCKCARLPHSICAQNRVRCCALDHAPGLGVCALDTMLCALRCSGRYGAVGMLERSTWTRWPDCMPGVCSIGSTSRMPRGSGRALPGSLICSDEKIGVPLYARVRTIWV